MFIFTFSTSFADLIDKPGKTWHISHANFKLTTTEKLATSYNILALMFFYLYFR